MDKWSKGVIKIIFVLPLALILLFLFSFFINTNYILSIFFAIILFAYAVIIRILIDRI